MSGVEGFYVHTISVETFAGSGAYGDVFNAPVIVPGFLSGSQKLVRSSTGEQVVANSMFYTYPANVGYFTTDSRVTNPDGTISRVVMCDLNDSGPLGLPDHVAVALI